MEFIVINFKKKNIISLHDLLLCQYTLCIVHTRQQAFSFSHKIQFIFPQIFPSPGLCPCLASPERSLWMPHEFVRTRHLIFNCFYLCSIGVLMCSYIHAHVYFTSICNLLLFLIGKWSQFLLNIFIEAQNCYTYIVLTCCTKVCVLTDRIPYCSFTQVIRVVMSIFAQSL